MAPHIDLCLKAALELGGPFTLKQLQDAAGYSNTKVRNWTDLASGKGWLLEAKVGNGHGAGRKKHQYTLTAACLSSEDAKRIKGQNLFDAFASGEAIDAVTFLPEPPFEYDTYLQDIGEGLHEAVVELTLSWPDDPDAMDEATIQRLYRLWCGACDVNKTRTYPLRPGVDGLIDVSGDELHAYNAYWLRFQQARRLDEIGRDVMRWRARDRKITEGFEPDLSYNQFVALDRHTFFVSAMLIHAARTRATESIADRAMRTARAIKRGIHLCIDQYFEVHGSSGSASAIAEVLQARVLSSLCWMPHFSVQSRLVGGDDDRARIMAVGLFVAVGMDAALSDGDDDAVKKAEIHKSLLTVLGHAVSWEVIFGYIDEFVSFVYRGSTDRQAQKLAAMLFVSIPKLVVIENRFLAQHCPDRLSVSAFIGAFSSRPSLRNFMPDQFVFPEPPERPNPAEKGVSRDNVALPKPAIETPPPAALLQREPELAC